MPVFVTTISSTGRHGVSAVEVAPQLVLTPAGTDVVAMAGQFPWGPVESLYTPTGVKDLYNTFAPAGFSRSGTGMMAVAVAKVFPELRIVRVLHSDAVAASSTLIDSGGPTNIVVVNAKFKGVAGNSLTATVSAASDSNSNHFNLTVTITGASGTTSDIVTNLNYSGVGADSTPDLSSALLITSIVKSNAGRPTNGTYSFTSGSDGSAIVSADYVGTQGLGDKGLALMETDASIRHVFVDDTGNSLRATVNAGIEAHCIYMGDRVGYINGNSGQTASSAQTDVANYRSDRIVYCDPWAKEIDPVTGNLTLTVSSPFAASVASQLVPSTSIAWKSPEVVSGMLSGIRALEFNRGQSAADNTAAGIATFIPELEGGFSIEAGVTAEAPVDPTKKNLTRRRMGDFIAITFINSTRSFVDGPNVPFNQNNLVTALETLLSGLKNAQNTDPNHTTYIVDYHKISSADLAAANDPTSLANGLFIIPAIVKIGSSMEHIYLAIQFGEGVSVL